MKTISPLPFSVLIFMTLLLIACKEQKKKTDPMYDDSLYTSLSDEKKVSRFFRGKDGNMYIRTFRFEKSDDPTSNMVYFYQQVPELDLNTFVQLENGGWYAKDKNHVYIWQTNNDGEHISIFKEADAASFTCFGYRWAKDTSHVYSGESILKGADPATIQPVCYDDSSSASVYIEVLRDNDQLFTANGPVTVPAGIDVSKLECVYDMMSNIYLWYKGEDYIIRNDSLVND